MKRIMCLGKLALFVVFAASLQYAQSTPPISPRYFGLHTSSGVAQREAWPTLPFASIRLLDTHTNWAQLNPAPGVYDWTLLDRWMAKFRLSGTTGSDVIYSFQTTPQWAAANPNNSVCRAGPGTCEPPSDLNADGTGTNQHWIDFVTALSQHVAGRIKYWEVWNEPMVTPFFSGTPAQLVRMAKDLRAITQALDPKAQILSPPGSDYHVSPSGTCYAANTMSQYFAAGMGQYIDIVSFHAYIAYRGGVDAPENFISEVSCIRQMMATYGQQNKGLWATEGGWGRNTDLPDPDQQAAFLARSYLLLRSLGVRRFFWYRWDNSDWGTLWDKVNGIHSAGIAYRQVATWMTGSTLTSACAQDSSGTWNCGFTLPNGSPAEAVWSLTNQQFAAPTNYTSYRDLAGNTYQLPANHQIMIGYKPIFLQ
jgi:hypothetical protein